MKHNLFSKIITLLIICFFIATLLAPAQELHNIYEKDDKDLVTVNSYLPKQIINPINSVEFIVGEKLDTSAYGPSFIEHMDDSISRDLYLRSNLDTDFKNDNDHHGTWVVSSKDSSYNTHSGDYNVINKWGDTEMSIAFPYIVDIHGAWFTGQGGESVWARSIRVIGYRNGEPIQTTDWFEDIDYSPSWFPMNLYDVDRMVIDAIPSFNGAGWYSMDDLTYSYNLLNEQDQSNTIVIDFEDCYFNQNLKDSNYAGLIWETGTGSYFNDIYEKSNIKSSSVTNITEMSLSEKYNDNSHENKLTSPSLLSDFQGVIRGDADSWSYPPDSCGAAGPNNFVEVVNRNFAIYKKSTGEELVNILLYAFLPGSNGDPRVLYDQFSERWFIIVCDFNTRIYLAVSTSDDPTGDWFKCSFVVSQGSDAGKWPDYPTLGVDEVGIYTAAYMIGGGSRMSIFAIDKAPLIDSEPSLGDIYAFRDLPWEGAIQPVHTFDSSDGEYFVSCASSTGIRVRLLTNLLSDPILTELCLVTIPYYSTPPDAPALGSTVPLDTVDYRLMNAVYRDGYIWTAHCINVDGRAACRWYKIDVSSTTLEDYGTVQDSVMYYYFPSIMVNAGGDVIMGFSGSHSNQYAAAYYTGRLVSDPPGEMAPPILLKEGEDTYNLIDGYGRNRWGDYSLCSLDPVKQTFWTIQEYAHSHNVGNDTNRWGTWIGELAFNQPPNAPEITGPTIGAVQFEYDFTFISEDPDDDEIYFYIDWGDGEIQDWTGPFPPDEEKIFNHIWSESGTYEIIAKSKDTKNLESFWSEPLTIKISNPPNAPNINGQNNGNPGISYEFGFTSIDPDGDNISEYIINWNDDNPEEVIVGPFISGEEVKICHIWEVKGEFIITAKAKDINGIVGPESTFSINIPKNRLQINAFWLKLIDILSIFSKLLNNLI